MRPLYVGILCAAVGLGAGFAAGRSYTIKQDQAMATAAQKESKEVREDYQKMLSEMLRTIFVCVKESDQNMINRLMEHSITDPEKALGFAQGFAEGALESCLEAAWNKYQTK